MSVASFLKSKASFWTSLNVSAKSTVCFVDSSFNPPQRAHLKLAQLCRAEFPHCYLIFMLGTGNAEKPSVAPEELQTRVDMIQLLINDEFPQDSRVGWALTTESMFLGKAQVVNLHLQPAKTVFAVGFDTLIRLGDQKFYQSPVAQVLAKLFTNTDILVLTRDEDGISKTPTIGSADAQLELIKSSPVFGPFKDHLIVCPCFSDTSGVSSSFARQSEANLRAVTSPSVADYALHKDLYSLRNKAMR